MMNLYGMKDKKLVEVLSLFNEMIEDLSFESKINYNSLNKNLKYSIEDGVAVRNEYGNWNKAKNNITLTKAYAEKLKGEEIAILITYMVLDRICSASKTIGSIPAVQSFTYNDEKYYLYFAGRYGIYALLPNELFKKKEKKSILH